MVDKICVCASIDGCMDCSDDKTCLRCSGNKKLNNTFSPHACLDTCPEKTFELDDKCILSCPLNYLVKSGKCVKCNFLFNQKK